jgi:hypothetical protein
VKLYLDDVRPCPLGWTLAKTVRAAQILLHSGLVTDASLDHDLGACESCLAEWRKGERVHEMPNCEHFGTGYTLVCWMEKTGIWPKNKTTVHSMNPVGRARMQQAIDRAWYRRNGGR